LILWVGPIILTVVTTINPYVRHAPSLKEVKDA